MRKHSRIYSSNKFLKGYFTDGQIEPKDTEQEAMKREHNLKEEKRINK